MKQLALITVILLMFGCGSGDTSAARENVADSTKRVDDSISNLVVLKADTTRAADSVANARVTDSIARTAANAEPTYRASFRVMYTSNSCGGARPTQEMVEQYGTPTPLATSSVRFRNHHTGKEYILKTDSKGEVSADMEEGKYDVFFTKDINPNLAHTGFDPKCSTWLNQLLLTVKVTANGKMQDVNVHFVCNPCDDQSKMRQ